MLGASLALLTGAHAGAATVIGGTTTFTVDPGIESIYNSLNVSASLIPPATGNLESEPQTLTLPITSGDTTTELDHSGGVILQELGLTVDITDVVIHFSGDEGNKVIADLSFQGTTENLAVADLNGSNSLLIDPAFAKQIQAFGGPNLTGTSLATFDSQPELASTTAPEPVHWSLIVFGLCALVAGKANVRARQRGVSRE